MFTGKYMRKAIVKFNYGVGALLCNRCGVIMAYGFDHEDKEHICDECIKKEKQRLNKTKGKKK